MRTLGLAVAAICLLAAGPVLAERPAPTGNMIGLSVENGRIAYDFIDMWFNQKKPEAAFDTFVSRTDYVNHSMISKTEKQTFESQKAAEAKITPPNARFEFKQLVAQGDLVFAHIHAFGGGPSVHGDEMVIILRVRGGKIIDHWDLHIPVTADSNVFERLER